MENNREIKHIGRISKLIRTFGVGVNDRIMRDAFLEISERLDRIEEAIGPQDTGRSYCSDCNRIFTSVDSPDCPGCKKPGIKMMTGGL
jgi:hypothetical protein